MTPGRRSQSEDDPVPIKATLAEARANLERRSQQAPRRPLWDEDETAEVRADLAAERQALRWSAMCPSKFLWASLDDFAEEQPASVVKDLTDWAEAPAARNLVLLGPVGAGKSRAACAAGRVLAGRGLDVLFLPLDELLDRIWSRSDQAALAEIATVDLLIIDDLASDPMTEWGAGRVFVVINRRYLEERPTIVTTNLEPADLEVAVGERTYSRLVGEDALILRLSGRDRRRSPAVKQRAKP